MARQSKKAEQIVGAADPDDIVRVVARRLQEERIRVGLSQTALAEKAGVSQNYIYELEYGTTNLTIRTLDQIARALNFDIREAFPGPPMEVPTSAELKRVTRALESIAKLRDDLEKLLETQRKIE